MDSVLIVDDSLESIMVVQKMIKKIFPTMKIIMATSADEALKLVQNTTTQIAFAFFDYNLEEGNGISLMIRMKKFIKASRMILYTAEDNQDVVDQVRNIGSKYLKKPITESELKKIVQAMT